MQTPFKGTIEIVKGKFLAKSELEPTDDIPFNTMSAASWFLSIIKDRHDAREYRLGMKHV
ncbi:MAG: hypothetical protein HOO86_09970 [Bacteroidales bacterium]|nr:hypothetical protein [Bacteroidales bacterium]